VFVQLMLDKSFARSNPPFTQQALSAFRKFSSQLVIVATVQNPTTIRPYIDSVVMVSREVHLVACDGAEPRPTDSRTARLATAPALAHS
jgi:uncharacterized protein YPO0396